jgi:hypothetical protein
MCEFSWDFQGLSPILQVAPPGMDPGDTSHEDKRQCPLLIAPLRQGRLNFNVSSVGAISITEAATSRESREGLYDWKFINALVSPDDESPKRLIDVLHDKRTMKKLLQVVDLLNNDLYKFANYLLTQGKHTGCRYFVCCITPCQAILMCFLFCLFGQSVESAKYFRARRCHRCGACHPRT